MKETDRSSAAGDRSPETLISHYAERRRDGRRGSAGEEEEDEEGMERDVGREEMDRSKGWRGGETKKKTKSGGGDNSQGCLEVRKFGDVLMTGGSHSRWWWGGTRQMWGVTLLVKFLRMR